MQHAENKGKSFVAFDRCGRVRFLEKHKRNQDRNLEGGDAMYTPSKTLTLGIGGPVPGRQGLSRSATRAEVASAMIELISVLEGLGLCSASPRMALCKVKPQRSTYVR